MVLIWTCLAVARGADVFPDIRLDKAQVEAVWTPEILGPPARTYDGTRVSPRVDRNRRILAAARGDDVGEIEVSDALARYAELFLAMRRSGVPDRVYYWLAAEHVGLANAPFGLGTFVAGNEEVAADLVKQLIAKAEDGASLAVATEDVEGGMAGVVVQADLSVAFEPFPRVVEPGRTLRIPGAVLDKRLDYALWVENTGTQVDLYPLEGDGPFDVEFAVPKEPGAYRIAMSAFEKKRLPDQAFFFTAYVGTDPPAALELPDFGAPETSIAEFETTLLATVNAERARHGLSPLTRSGDASTVRELLDGMPEGERALVRYLDRFVSQDPLPSVPHGQWGIVFGTRSASARSTAFTWVEHPVWRSRLLDDQFDRIVLGARTLGDGTYQVIGVLVAPADDGSLRDEAARQLTGRWPSGEPKPAPVLQKELDWLAEDVASGRLKTKKFSKGMQKVFDKGLIEGAASSWMTVVPPGGQVETAPMKIAPDADSLAVGFASGDLGGGEGFTYGVVIVVTAKGAR